jgi:type I restriction enzyme M protein
MAIKKSDLYSSLWASCDELRGGMDASQYKDYVLFMLFIKYVSDKHGDSDDFAPPVTIPKGAGFKDMIALKGKSDIGDKINNTQVIQPLRQFKFDPSKGALRRCAGKRSQYLRSL